MQCRATTPAPLYGSAEWCALRDNDPRKVASCVTAAECWAQAGDSLVDDLRAEVEAARKAHKVTEDADYQARAKAHRDESRNLSFGKSFAERRAEQLAAALPRPDDYQGKRDPVERARSIPQCPTGCRSECWRLAADPAAAVDGVDCRPPGSGEGGRPA